MRKELLIFIIGLMAITACTKRPETAMHRQLKQVEGMMRTLPDTALYLLTNLKSSPIPDETDSMYLELLIEEALMKNKEKRQDTTALLSLTAYYTAQADTPMMARAYRLSAVAYRDLECYSEAVSHYNTATALAKAANNKRLLADIYHELAHVHYAQRLLTTSPYPRILADSVFRLAESSGIELKDTSLWISSLVSRSLIARFYNKPREERDLLLSAWDLVTRCKDKSSAPIISMFLSITYAQLGEKEKSFAFLRQNLELRKGDISDHVYYFAIGHAYLNNGMKDSADYYINKAQVIQRTPQIIYSSPSEQFSRKSNEGILSLEQRLEQMRLNDTLRQQRIEQRNTHIVTLLTILAAVGIAILLFLKRNNLRKERCQRKQVEAEKQQLSHAHEQAKDLLQQHEEQLSQQREEMQRKENELMLMRREIEALSANAHSVVYKIQQIVENYQSCDASKLRMEESDWKLLRLEMDKQWNNAISKVQQEYRLTPNETHLLCLYLLEVPTTHITHFFQRSINTIYTWNRQLCDKLGIPHGNNCNFKNNFRNFIESKS